MDELARKKRAMTMQIGLTKPLFAANCVLLSPKCPTITQKNVFFAGHFVMQSFVFIDIPALNRKKNSPPPPPFEYRSICLIFARQAERRMGSSVLNIRSFLSLGSPQPFALVLCEPRGLCATTQGQ